MENKRALRFPCGFFLGLVSFTTFFYPLHATAFESVEHQAMGDALYLQFASETSKIQAGNYPLLLPNGLQLTYGQILALAGDFFSDFRKGHAISAPATLQARETQFENAFATLAIPYATSSPYSARAEHHRNTIVQRLIADFSTNAAILQRGMQQGLRASSIYRAHDWPKKYVEDAHGFNITEPFSDSNWDHFPDPYAIQADEAKRPNAWKAYDAGHIDAVALAIRAGMEAPKTPTAAEQDLQLAYAMNAFACHYLSDSYAAGHMRTPRKALQKNYGWAGVVLMGFMHDEDNLKGLQVHNGQGDHWTAFGDTHYFDAANQKNRHEINAVLQYSADGIWQGYLYGASHLKQLPPLPARLHDYQFVLPIAEKMAGETDALILKKYMPDYQSLITEHGGNKPGMFKPDEAQPPTLDFLREDLPTVYKKPGQTNGYIPIRGSFEAIRLMARLWMARGRPL